MIRNNKYTKLWYFNTSLVTNPTIAMQTLQRQKVHILLHRQLKHHAVRINHPRMKAFGASPQVQAEDPV